MRQTLALEAKLERDRKTAEREDHEIAKRAVAFRAARRKVQVKLAVERCVWSEADGDEAENLLNDLDDLLELCALSDSFAGDDPVDTHVVRIFAELGSTRRKPWRPAGLRPNRPRPLPFPPPSRWKRLGDPGGSTGLAKLRVTEK